jgi:hypothetical protein
VTFYQTTRRYILGNSSLHVQRHRNPARTQSCSQVSARCHWAVCSHPFHAHAGCRKSDSRPHAVTSTSERIVRSLRCDAGRWCGTGKTLGPSPPYTEPAEYSTPNELMVFYCHSLVCPRVSYGHNYARCLAERWAVVEECRWWAFATAGSYSGDTTREPRTCKQISYKKILCMLFPRMIFQGCRLVG